MTRVPTLAGRWRQAVASGPDRPFLDFEDREERVHRWTYAEWDDLVARTASRLVALGAGRESRVHVALANSPAFVALWLACVRIGAVLVPSDPRGSEREFAAHIRQTRPVIGVCGSELVDDYRAAAGDGPRVIAVDEDDCALDALAGAGELASAPEPEGAAPAAILFTSGTTTKPKGVVVTQANYAFVGDAMAAAAGARADDRFLVVLPLFHANAQYYSFAAAISAGAAVCLMATFSASRFTAQAIRHRATHASLFAAPMRMILARTADPATAATLRHCWYAQNLAADQVDAFAGLVGCRPRQLYGMTETIAAVLTQRTTDEEPGVLGEPTLACDVELRAPDGDDRVADGQVGEITVRGTPGHTLFAGYFEDEAVTSAAFRDGRFRTGDLAVRQPDGRYRFVGRRNDVLKVAGENVSTVEIEAVLEAHPEVFEAAVVRAPDRIRDEVPLAYVVRVAGAGALDEAGLLAYAAERLAPSKRPRAVHFVDALPRTSVGKVRKFMLGA